MYYSNATRYVLMTILILISDALRGSSVRIGAIQGRFAWPLRKDDTHKSRSVDKIGTNNTANDIKC